MSATDSILNRLTSPYSKEKGGLYFDGVDDFVKVPYNAALDLQTMTVGMLIENLDLSKSKHFINKRVSLSALSWRSFNLYFETGEGYRFYINDGTTARYVSTYDVSTAGLHYLVGTFDGSELVIHLDGSVKNRNDLGPVTITYDNNPLYIAGFDASPEAPQIIHFLHIHDRVLSGAEIKNIFAKKDQIPTDGLVVYHDYTRGHINDLSGNGHNGMLYGAPRFTHSNNFKLMKTTGDGMDETRTILTDITNSHFIDQATGKSLERIGVLLQTPRETSETDAHYRARLKTMWQKYIGSATIQDIKTITASMLEVSTNRIIVTEDFTSTYAHFRIKVFLSDLQAVGISSAELKDAVGAIKGAGISTEISTDGTFEARTAADPNDATKGYNDIANSNPGGGTYSGIL